MCVLKGRDDGLGRGLHTGLPVTEEGNRVGPPPPPRSVATKALS